MEDSLLALNFRNTMERPAVRASWELSQSFSKQLFRPKLSQEEFSSQIEYYKGLYNFLVQCLLFLLNFLQELVSSLKNDCDFQDCRNTNSKLASSLGEPCRFCESFLVNKNNYRINRTKSPPIS